MRRFYGPKTCDFSDLSFARNQLKTNDEKLTRELTRNVQKKCVVKVRKSLS
ncbi:MAG: hypothetical protein H0U87_05720 [Acidobacteria bacterium]|nr:hypothetical protein [Acidobacteriota bacterium]